MGNYLDMKTLAALVRSKRVKFDDSCIDDLDRDHALQVEFLNSVIDEGKEAMTQAATIAPGILPAGRLTAEKRKELLKSKTVRAATEKTRLSVIAARDATMKRILKSLSKRQRASFEKMIGEPFDFEKLRPTRPASEEDSSAVKATP